MPVVLNEFGAVQLDYAIWQARYPELAPSVPEGVAEQLWADAGAFCKNDCTSIVVDPVRRASLLGMLVAHIAKLTLPINGEQPSGLVGRIASAGEGSVSVSTDMGSQPAGAAWFQQTQYGAMFWQATAQYRTMRYYPGPRPYLGVGYYPAGRVW